MIRGKTAALFAAATEVGGVIARAPEATVDALSAYGDALGVAFQMADDLLDYGGRGAALGKNVGDDFRERKMTLPIIRALAAADAEGDAEERAFWARTIGRGQQETGDLDLALAILKRRGALVAAHDAARAHADRARAALAALPAGPIRDDLADLAEFVVDRRA